MSARPRQLVHQWLLRTLPGGTRVLLLGLLLGGALAAMPAGAAAGDSKPEPTAEAARSHGGWLPDDWVALSEAELSEWRGGFTNRDGVLVRFSFESLVRVNGETLSALQWENLELPLASSMRQRAEVSGLFMHQLEAVSSEGLRLHSMDSGMTVVLQNSLDNQVIQLLRDMDVQLEGVRLGSRLGSTQRMDEVMRAHLVETLR